MVLQILSIKGMRCWVKGTATEAGTGLLLATCEAQLVDLAQLWAAQRKI